MEGANMPTVLVRIIESSPLIVLILVAGYGAMAKFVNGLLVRIDTKDAELLKISREMIVAVKDVEHAVDRLTDTVKERRD
jgi:hypothetical protein